MIALDKICGFVIILMVIEMEVKYILILYEILAIILTGFAAYYNGFDAGIMLLIVILICGVILIVESFLFADINDYRRYKR